MDQHRRIADATGEMAALALNLTRLRIVAIDLEYTVQEHGFHELGLAIWDRGRRSGRHIVIGEGTSADGYLHGTAERMGLEQACDTITEAMSGADAIAGHDLSGDRLKLKGLGVVLPPVPVYDTARISKRIFIPPLQAQLRAMLQIYGVSPEGLHVAGNDAWAVVDLLVEMGRQGPSPCAGPDGDYAHPRSRADILRDRHTATGYEVEPGGRRTRSPDA
jgi:hypothetical protein